MVEDEMIAPVSQGFEVGKLGLFGCYGFLKKMLYQKTSFRRRDVKNYSLEKKRYKVKLLKV
jgi:hypothetical protein